MELFSLKMPKPDFQITDYGKKNKKNKIIILINNRFLLISQLSNKKKSKNLK